MARSLSIFFWDGVRLRGLLTLAAIAALWIGSAQAADIWVEARRWGGSFIFIAGDINFGDEQKFAALHPPQPVYVRPSGPGGKVMPALAIADTIWERGYKTELMNNDDECASACTIIWLSGRQVIVQNSAILGFHSCASNGHDDMDFLAYELPPTVGRLLGF
jgi:hypothetical protein